ncbi:MAG: EAL domain-containing protein [Oscillospiraceae bacterium]
MKAQRENRNKRSYILLIVLAVFLAGLLWVFIQQYTSRFKTTLSEETETYMVEIAQQVTMVMNERVDHTLLDLQSDALTIEAMGEETPSQFKAYLQREAGRFGYTQLSLAGVDGISINSLGNSYHVSNRPHYLAALKGVPAVSEVISSGVGSPDCIEYAVPVYQNGEIAGVLMASYTLDSFRDVLQVNMFDMQGSAMVVNSQGVVVVSQSDAAPYNFSQTLKKDQSVTDEDRLRFTGDISHEKSGVLTYTAEGTASMLYYQPLGINQWSILISVPTDVVAYKTDLFLKGIVYISGAIALLIVTLMLTLVYLQYHNRKQLETILYVDPVTEGATQAKFERDAGKLLASEESCGYALVQMNLQKFKLINTTFGREAGNRTLKYIHKTIGEQLRENELAARLSADKFGLLLQFHSKEELSHRLAALCTEINSFNNASRNQYILQFELGVCLIAAPGQQFDVLLERANFAHQHGSKLQMGQSSIAFYDDVERSIILQEKEMENSMEQALENGEFEMYLQPKYELEHRSIGGAEALVRWNSPEKGMIYPGDFIPLFERNGFVVKIDLYMFEQACKLQQLWKDTGVPPVPISVNMSRVHLNDPDFLERYKEIFCRYDFPAKLLEIELTESMVFDDVARLCEVIGKVKEVGFTCSLDDFGSGYSSLNLLKDIPVDTLKLDRSFFYSKNEDETHSRHVVGNIVDLAKKLHMQTVSEGIETLEWVEYLHSVSCDMVQGYVFAKPMPVAQFEKLMQKNP